MSRYCRRSCNFCVVSQPRRTGCFDRHVSCSYWYSTGGSSSFLQENDEVALLPLKNQVGGHTRLLLLNQNTICKPLNCRELDFLSKHSTRHSNFLFQKFKGVLQASNSSEVTLDKRYSPSFRKQDNNKQGHNSSKRKREECIKNENSS